MPYETRSILEVRSVIVAVVLFLVGTAMGFGVGYKYERHTASTKVHSSSSRPSEERPTSNSTTSVLNDAAASRVAKVRAAIIACMAKGGVKYAAGTTDFSKPPPGVSLEKFGAVRTFCGRAFFGATP